MRILHCLAQYPDRTGSGIYCRNLISNLAQNAELEQALIYGRNPEQAAMDFGIPSFPLLFDTPERPFPLPGMSDQMPYRSTVYHKMDQEMLAAWRAGFRERLETAIASFKPDLIIAHHLWILSSLCLETGLPVLGICHGTDLRQARQNPEFCASEVAGLERILGVVALTREQVPELMQHCGIPEEKIMIGGGAYDSSIFYSAKKEEKAARPRDGICFLYSGKMVESKGIFELLEAFISLPKDKNYHLELIGHTAPDMLPRINEYIRKDDRIHLRDAESQQALADDLRLCDVFVFSSYYEGLGLMALEAMAAGLRLVTNDLPALRSFLGDDILAQPQISVLPMPELEGIDQIKEEAREEHIARLREAMLEQAKFVLDGQNCNEEFMQKIQQFSWKSLSDRIINFAMNLYKV